MLPKIGFRCPVCNAVLHVTSPEEVAVPVDPEFATRTIAEIYWGKNFDGRIKIMCALSEPPIVTVADLIKKEERVRTVADRQLWQAHIGTNSTNPTGPRPPIGGGRTLVYLRV